MEKLGQPLYQKQEVGFVERELWPEYDLSESIAPIFSPRKNGEWIEYGIWPLYVHVYFGDKEPSIPAKKFIWPHVYVWDRSEEVSIGKGWRRVGKKSRKLTGYLEVTDDKPYFYSWNRTAKIERNRWLRTKDTYEIDEVDVSTFVEHYTKSSTYTNIRKEIASNTIQGMQKRITSGKVELQFLVVRDRATKNVRAGIAYELSKNTTNTYYTAGFVENYTEEEPLMLGLITEWIERGMSLGYSWFNFGIFWQEGDPETWKGYSQFKKKFGVRFCKYPESLLKIKWFW